MFFGREDVFSWIERSLAGKYVDHILVLHGQRRVGKTSVLKQIPNFLPDKYVQVFFDLQGRTNTSLDRFMWWLAREIARTLKQERGLQIQRPNRDDFAADPEFLLNDFLPGLRPLLGDQVLLLTFDEFDTLDRDEIQDSFAKPLIATLRRLMELDYLNFIFSIGSSGDKLENMQASYTDFFKSALYRKISFLTGDDAHRLITKPVEGVIEYERKAVARIAEITSGHPYFTQLLCHELFSLCQKTGSRKINQGDVESVLEDVIERGTVNLKFVWDEANDLEKWILAGLAHLEGPATTPKLSQLLQKQRLRFSESDLNSAVIHLRDKDVITQENQFIIHLMRMWLQANRPLDRVREELVEVNPIANRYIEIGDEYRDMGQAVQAIESYQQALSADPGNLKAQASIGTVHFEQRAYTEAAAAFELALQIDDEDVVARTGFCDAHLALGDQARQNDLADEAIGFFQKILIINPAHTDARQHLADIYVDRAEGLLTAGQDDAALAAFNRALDYTPEDDRLTARYEAVLAEKKAKVVAEWLAKADRSVARQRWDEAAGFVEEALKIDPANPALQAKLVEVKDAPRQHKILGYKNEAEQALQRGNFEKAIAALETAALLAPEDATLAEWLANTRSDRINAQLKVFRDQAARASAAGEWDAAIAAYQQAAKITPDDPAWMEKIAEARAAKLQAQLDDCQARVDRAVAQGQWAAALDAVNAALQIAPDPARWQAQQTEIEAARHQAQLQALREAADSDRASQNWDAALAAFEDYLKLEPGDRAIQAEIEAIRAEKRQHHLTEFKTQAETATKAENWAAAVTAWEHYLALQPEGQPQAEENLRQARKYAKISADYSEAQQAIRKKRYGRAIELLQTIIAQDPTYKSTSRLLVEAVEADKALPIWQRPWVLPVAGVLIVILLAVFLGPGLWASISSTSQKTPEVVPSTVTAVAVVEVEDQITHTPTLEPEATVTPTVAHEITDPTPTTTPIATESELNLLYNKQIFQGPFIDLDWSVNGLIAAAGNENSAVVLNAADGEITQDFSDPEQVFSKVAWHPNGETLTFGTASGILRFYLLDDSWQGPWDIYTLSYYGGINDLGYSISGDRFAVVVDGSLDEYGGYVGIWNTSNNARDFILKYFIHDDAQSVDWLPDENTFLTVGTGHEGGGVPGIRMHTVDNIYESTTLRDTISPFDISPDGIYLATFQAASIVVLTDDQYQVSSVVARPDFQADAFGFSHSGTIYDIAWSPDSRYLAAVGADGIVNVWEIADQTTKRPAPIRTFDAGVDVTTVVWSPDSTAIAAGDVDGNLWVWNLDRAEIGEQEETLPGDFSEAALALAYLDENIPTFEDDFSDPKSEWGSFNNAYGLTNVETQGALQSIDAMVADGVLHYRGPEAGVVGIGERIFAGVDFALSFDFEFTSPLSPDLGNLRDYIGVSLRETDGSKLQFTLAPGETSWYLNREYQGFQQVQDGGVAAKAGTVLIVAYGEQFAIFLDDELLTLYEDADLPTGETNQILIGAGLETRLDFDNVKFWNLDGVELDANLQAEASTQTIDYKSGDILKSPKDGMDMVYIGAGEFLMGASELDSAATDAEKPQHKVYLDAYWIDRTEVTNAMFAGFLNDLGNQNDGIHDWYLTDGRQYSQIAENSQGIWEVNSGYENHPVIGVSWNGANAYCEWAGRRLPTEAEWEKAARGTDGRKFPWGPIFDCRLLNSDDETDFDANVSQRANCDGYAGTAPVGSYPGGASPYGVLDLLGNVSEWVVDYFSLDYYSVSPYENPQGPSIEDSRGHFARGGSLYGSSQIEFRIAYRNYFYNQNIINWEDTGVRCALTP